MSPTDMRLGLAGNEGVESTRSRGFRAEVCDGPILTLNAKNSHPVWTERTALLPGYGEYFVRTGWRPFWRAGALDAYWGYRLFRESRRFAAVFTANERCSWVFALLQLFRGRHRVAHFQLEFIWNPPARRWLRVLKVAAFRLQHRAVDGIVVFSDKQAKRYSAFFPFAANKFKVIPFHTTLYDTPIEPSEGSYIFAGGDICRDYRTLVEAVRGSDWDVVIAAARPDHFEGMDLPRNVRVVKTGREEFFRLMAGAAVVVVPLRKDLLHVGGHQTYLNAMALGKPVVVADDCGADEYISHGLTGLVVRPGDPAELRKALLSVLENREFGRALGRAAKESAKRYSPEHFFKGVLSLIDYRTRLRISAR